MKRAKPSTLHDELWELFGQGTVRKDERAALLQELAVGDAEDALRNGRNPHDCHALGLVVWWVLTHIDECDAQRAKDLLDAHALVSLPFAVEWARDDGACDSALTGEPLALELLTSHEVCFLQDESFDGDVAFIRSTMADLLPATFFDPVVKVPMHPRLCTKRARWDALPRTLPGLWHEFTRTHFKPAVYYEHLDSLEPVPSVPLDQEAHYSLEILAAHTASVDTFAENCLQFGGSQVSSVVSFRVLRRVAVLVGKSGQ
jgi:hypothetical protein